ncbi:MAG: hypothetical protein AAFU78_16015 [Cyanobacteria bacterium J06633_2]
MKKRQHPEVEGHNIRSLYTFEFRKRGHQLRDRLFWSGGGLLVGIGIAVGVFYRSPLTRQPLAPAEESSTEAPDSFQQGIQNAMQAAQDTQTAEFREDWIAVAMLWQRAINYMQDVSTSNMNYALAAQKVNEYQRNLQYAQSNVEARESNGSNSVSFWSPGSSRSMVLAIEGTPSRIERYDSLCLEKLYYDESFVELANGQVSQFDNASNNLSVLVTPGPSQLITQGDRLLWTLGSSKSDVLSIEGPPTHIKSYDFIDKEFYYYDDDWIEFENDVVTGYINRDDVLSVAVGRAATSTEESRASRTNQHWSLGSSREDVLRIQRTVPTQISRNGASCEETIHYGTSRVELKNGVVSGYDNLDNTLQVR